MPKQTCKASKESPGWCLIYERGEVVTSFQAWSVVAVYEMTKPDKFGSTALSFQRNDGEGFWINTFCSVAEVQSAIDDGIAAWKRARPMKLVASEKLKKAVAAASR